MNKLVKSIAFFAVAATAELACAYGLSDSFFVLNGTVKSTPMVIKQPQPQPQQPVNPQP